MPFTAVGVVEEKLARQQYSCMLEEGWRCERGWNTGMLLDGIESVTG